MNLSQQLASLGIVGLPPRLLDDKAKADLRRRAAAYALVGDAALPQSAPNNAVPEWLTAYVSPETIRIITAPTKAEEIYQPIKRGEWGCGRAVFKQVEHTEMIEEYGDRSTEGVTGYNVTFPDRQEYRFQTMSYYGDLEAAVMSMVGVNSSMEVQEATASSIRKGHNRIWFYGVEDLRNYGILNDPDLPAPIAPIADSGGNITWGTKDADSVYNDFLAMFDRLSVQTGGLVEKSDPLTLAISNRVSTHLAKKNEYGVTAEESIKKTFPNLRIVTAVEYSTPAGELAQLKVDSLDSQVTGQLGYTELLHAHGVIRLHSSYEEKKSAGNFGAVIYKPMNVAQMLGI